MLQHQELGLASLPKLPDISETAPLSDEDRACISEIREVLKKHNRLHRFGLNLLHQHFDVADDECLVESCNRQTRTLTIKPVKKSEVAEKPKIETNWRLDSNDASLLCVVECLNIITHDGREVHEEIHDE